MDMGKVHGLVSFLCSFATLSLIALAVGSIVIFVKVFKSDFSNPD